jgi:hypothetical protein
MAAITDQAFFQTPHVRPISRNKNRNISPNMT